MLPICTHQISGPVVDHLKYGSISEKKHTRVYLEDPPQLDAIGQFQVDMKLILGI